MLVAKATDGDITLRIHQDELRESPREDFDNLGTMVCWHRDYELGDKHDFDAPDDFQRWLKDNPSVVLPLILLDHSGISMSTSRVWPYDCPWDAGQVGLIYCTHEKIKREYSVEEVNEELAEKVQGILEDEVKVYDQYLQGDVYGFTITRNVVCESCSHGEDEHIDSCWGFYGHDWKENGMIDHVEEEHRHLFDKLEDC